MTKVGGESMTFLVDTRAEHSTVTTSVAPLTGRTATVIGATGNMATHSFYKAHSCQLGGHLVTHEFVLTGMPHSPAGQTTDKAGGTDHLCPWEASEPHPGEPISSDDGCNCVQGR